MPTAVLEDVKMESIPEEEDSKPVAATAADTATTKKRPRSESVENGTAALTMEQIAAHKTDYAASVAAAAAPSLQPLLKESLEDMLDGIPRKELKMIVAEAKECELAIEKELEQLKIALEQEIKSKQEEGKASSTKENEDEVTEAVNMMLESEVTPPDHFWTVSSLLGRLRHDLTTPLPPNSQIQVLRDNAGIQSVQPPPAQKKRKSSVGTAFAATAASSTPTDGTGSGRTTPINRDIHPNISQFERLQQIREHPDWTAKHENSEKLMAVWKKISTHRSSIVFRRPVSDKDAPGYSDRIHFKMDLSLIRKFILNSTITSYADIASRIHLIAHNCVKYNGRESDYALVTREFESYAAEFLMTATLGHSSGSTLGSGAVNAVVGKKAAGTPMAAAAAGGDSKPAPAAAAVGANDKNESKEEGGTE